MKKKQDRIGSRRFSRKAISEVLPCELIRWEVYYYPELESTQKLASEFFCKEDRGGIFIASNYQKQGRGREGRSWISPRGQSLLFSLILLPGHSSSRLHLLTITGAVAVCDALVSLLNLSPEVKWPNDVLLNGKKICGILTEMVKSKKGNQGVIMGIGVNVNQKASDFSVEFRQKASSLFLETGEKIQRLFLLGSIMKSFENNYFLFQKGSFQEIIRKWKGYSSMLGRRVVLGSGNKEVQGTVIDLEDNGALILRLDTGKTQAFLSSDCHFI